MNEYNKLVQKDYKRNWMRKVIHWEMCKKFKFEHTNKWYRHNLESVLDHETYKLLCDFDIQTRHLISAIRSDLVIVNKKKKKKKKVTLPNCGLCLKESEQEDIYLDLNRQLKEIMDHKSDGDTTCKWGTSSVTKGLIKGLEDLEIRGKVETIQTTTLLRSARILRRVLET